jgi:hypothetical protein
MNGYEPLATYYSSMLDHLNNAGSVDLTLFLNAATKACGHPDPLALN